MRNNQAVMDFRFRRMLEYSNRAQLSRDFKFALIFSAIHVAFGGAFFMMGSAAIIHPLAAFSLGMYWAFQKKFPLGRLSMVCAYMIGSEVLWRMADLAVPWEFGKYGTAVLMIVALARRGMFKIPALAAAYLLLLLPSCILVISNYYPEFAKISISFNMSGPLLLFMSCWYFSYTKFRPAQIKKLLIVGVAPLISVATATLFVTVSNPDIQFSLESNSATSGGFGPNQVSSMLGLGVFLAVAILLLFKDTSKEKLLFGVMAVFLAAQSVMTFSRGGIYNAVGATLVLFFFQVKDMRSFIKRAVPISALVLLFLFLIFPLLNAYTGGMLEERFESTESTNRVEIIESDLQILAENPIFGVGVGVANSYRSKFLEFSSASHTEFSRMISEHGLLGIGAICCLILMTFLNLKQQRKGFGRAFTAGMAMWAFLFMLNAGMRLAAPSLLWGMTFASIVGTQARNKRRLRNQASRNALSSQEKNRDIDS